MSARDVKSAAERFSLLDHAPIGQFILREDFTVLFWNRCLEAWTGVLREAIVGKSLLDHYPHLGAPKYAARIMSVFSGGPPAIFSSQLHSYLIPAPLPGGKFRFQYSVVAGIPTTEEGRCYAMFAIQDVTSLTEAIENHRVALRQAMDEMEVRRKAEAELVRNAEELARLNEILEERSIRDGLTGLFNHLRFYEVLHRDFLLARRQQSDLGCLLLDLDHFKLINDTYGHPFGDAVLKGVAALLQKMVRKTDIVSRYGGEEFAILLPDTDLHGALVLAHNIRAGMEEHPFHHGDTAVTVTASIGVATFHEHRPALPQELLAFADTALYKAKAAGRNRVEAYPSPGKKGRRNLTRVLS